MILERIEIEDILDRGRGVGKHKNRVIFVEGTVPGDCVDINIVKKRRKYWEAKPIHFHQHSPNREKPACDYFGHCGGCQLQNLTYKAQLYFKEKTVTDALSRIADVDFPEPLPIISSDHTYFYRNKLEYTFSNKQWLTQEEIDSGKEFKDKNALGFHVPKRYDKVLHIDKCHLQEDISNQIRNEIYSYAIKHELPFFDIKEKSGLLRNLIIRNSTTGEVMIILSLYENQEPVIENLLKHLKDTFPQVNSLMYVINNKQNDTINDLDIICYSGNDHIIEQMGNLKFKIGPTSFFQTNSIQAKKLYQKVVETANFQGHELVYDLYCGTGTIGLFAAQYVQKVIGVESNPRSVKDAMENARMNDIENITFISGEVEKTLDATFLDQHGKPDIVILDPPRAGLHKNAVEHIYQMRPPKIVYVSCNPATQARDVEILSEVYTIKRIQPVDMFPQTQHVENIMLLELKS